MKRLLFTISLLFSITFMVASQISDSFVSSCVMNVGRDAKYLKDFRIELGANSNPNELRYKANISLWKNTTYRFSMCSADNSQGQLYLSLTDDANRVALTSYDKETGRTYQFVDFVCNKSGIYQINFDFTEGQQGSGVGVISIIR